MHHGAAPPGRTIPPPGRKTMHSRRFSAGSNLIETCLECGIQGRASLPFRQEKKSKAPSLQFVMVNFSAIPTRILRLPDNSTFFRFSPGELLRIRHGIITLAYTSVSQKKSPRGPEALGGTIRTAGIFSSCISSRPQPCAGWNRR